MKFFVFFGFVVLAITAVNSVAAEKKLVNVLDEIFDVVSADDVRSILSYALLDGRRKVALHDNVDSQEILNFFIGVVRDLDLNKDLAKRIVNAKVLDYDTWIKVWADVDSGNVDFSRDIAAEFLVNESKILKVLLNNIDNSSEFRSFLLRLRSRHNRAVVRKHLRSDYGKFLRKHVANNYLLDNIVSKLRFLLI